MLVPPFIGAKLQSCARVAGYRLHSKTGGALKVPSQGNEICYRLNDRDEIVFANEAWDAFASANSSKHLTATHVLGRSLWEFITDSTTRLLYRDILARIRGGHPLRLDFRCDSPDCRRLHEMEVSGRSDGLVEFRVRILSAEERQPQTLLEPDRPHSEELLRVCGWCKKVDVGGRWAEVEESISLLGLFERSPLPKITHAICEACYSRMVATLDEDEGSATPDTPAGDRDNGSS